MALKHDEQCCKRFEHSNNQLECPYIIILMFKKIVFRSVAKFLDIL